MAYLMRLVPGLIGATAAFVALEALIALGTGSLVLEAVVFLAVYALVTILAERAMAAYGKPKR